MSAESRMAGGGGALGVRVIRVCEVANQDAMVLFVNELEHC